MLYRLGKAASSVMMAASLIALFAAPSQAASAAQAPTAFPMYFSYGCDYGHACLRLRAPVANQFWNVEYCGDNGIYDYYNYAIAYGNPFTVYYQNGTWDYVAPWTQRTLDGTNLATKVHVYC